ncbi:transcription elongation factor TFIIS [Coemansia nantahalensis]|uniref:Transcription elongation factor TFIIS n=1 Tax=Coemansia nantahalensis TaxID=2789366 RepID=A0ACC1JQP6_9FUNG|nr:transcription elongation factor TFIIS [Coemansia nantahalensis]
MSSTVSSPSELKVLCKALGEAQESGDKTDQAEFLNKLLAVRVDEKLLRATGAGQVVGRLRSSDDAAIAALAKRPAGSAATPRQQPGAVRTGSSGSQSPAGRPPAASNGSTTPGGIGSAAAPETPATPTGDGAAQRTAALDGARLAKTGDSVRDKCAELLYNSMAPGSAADVDLLTRRALDIERIEFDKAKATSPAYRARIRSLCHNLRDKKNPELCQNVVEGAISVERFCSMTSEEMASKELRDTIEKMKEENLFKAKGAEREEAVTDQFKCGRCKKRKCTYYQLQTRSADEPMTTFVTCTVCNNRWKFC